MAGAVCLDGVIKGSSALITPSATVAAQDESLCPLVAQWCFDDPHMQEPLLREAFSSYLQSRKTPDFCDLTVCDCGL